MGSGAIDRGVMSPCPACERDAPLVYRGVIPVCTEAGETITAAESTAEGEGDQAAPRTETARQAPK